jgi:hypothetical protein
VAGIDRSVTQSLLDLGEIKKEDDMNQPWSIIRAEDFKAHTNFPGSGIELRCDINGEDVNLRYEGSIMEEEVLDGFKLLCSRYVSRRGQLLSFCEQMIGEHDDIGDVHIRGHLNLFEIYVSTSEIFDGSDLTVDPIGSVAFRFSLVDLDDSFFSKVDRFGPNAMLECTVPFSKNDNTWQWEEMFGDIVDFD